MVRNGDDLDRDLVLLSDVEWAALLLFMTRMNQSQPSQQQHQQQQQQQQQQQRQQQHLQLPAGTAANMSLICR